MEPEDYEQLVQRSRRRRRVMFAAALTVLVALLYVPWAFVSARLLSADTAEIISVFDALLVIACWRGLSLRLADSDTAEKKTVLSVGGGVAGGIALLAVASGLLGFIGVSGLVFSFALLSVLGGMLARALLFGH